MIGFLFAATFSLAQRKGPEASTDGFMGPYTFLYLERGRSTRPKKMEGNALAKGKVSIRLPRRPFCGDISPRR